MVEEKDLETTCLNGVIGLTEVKIGDEISLFDPTSIFDSRERHSQEYMNEKIVEQIGPPPYKLSRIVSTGVRILLDIEGEKGIYKGITRDYFCAHQKSN